MPVLSVENVHKQFSDTLVLQGITFFQGAGEVVAVIGPSGCGKSTLLSIIAGLVSPNSGRILWQGEDLSSVPTHLRGFGLMFQDFALFPHMNVGANIAFGLRMQKFTASEIDRQVDETLSLVGLPGFADRDVHNLSGGEQQRVALARVLAPKPRLLMLDEPLGSLDRALRERLLDDLRDIIRLAGQTTLYVTHDQEEAYALADRVILMNQGQIVQQGTPRQLFCQPASAFVARFLGLNNLLAGEAHGDLVDTPVGTFALATPTHGLVEVLLRPNAATLGRGKVELYATVVEVVFRGETTRLAVQVNNTRLEFDFASDQELPGLGQEIWLTVDVEKGLHVFKTTINTLPV